MKYALIGCGRIATNHIKAAVNNDLAIVAICDIVPEKMEQLLAKHGLEKETTIARFTDYKDMLTVVRPDFVSIATESGKHAEIALYCIDNGIHVIIEKPMAMSMKDADEIVRRSQEKNVKVAACHQNRFNIAVQKRIFNGVIDFRHAFHHRQRPFGGKDINHRLWVLTA